MKKILLLPLLLLSAVNSYGASFDCSKARSWPEKMICSDPILSIEDERLGKIYQLAKKKTGNSKEFKALVKRIGRREKHARLNSALKTGMKG